MVSFIYRDAIQFESICFSPPEGSPLYSRVEKAFGSANGRREYPRAWRLLPLPRFETQGFVRPACATNFRTFLFIDPLLAASSDDSCFGGFGESETGSTFSGYCQHQPVVDSCSTYHLLILSWTRFGHWISGIMVALPCSVHIGQAGNYVEMYTVFFPVLRHR